MDSTPLIQKNAFVADTFIQNPQSAQPVLYAFIEKPPKQNWWIRKGLLYVIAAVITLVTLYNFLYHDRHSHHPVVADPVDTPVANQPQLGRLFPIGDKTKVNQRLLTPTKWLNFKNIGFAVLEINTFQEKSLRHPVIEYQLFANDADARRHVEWSFDSTASNMTVDLKSALNNPKPNLEIKFQVNVTLPDLEGNPFSINGHGSLLEINWFPDTYHETLLFHSPVGSLNLKNMQAKLIDINSSQAVSINMEHVGSSSLVINANSCSFSVKKSGTFSNVAVDAKSIFIVASIDGVKIFKSISNTGSIDLELHTLADSQISIDTEVGSIQSSVYGFQGAYFVESQFGTCSVVNDSPIQSGMRCNRDGVIGNGGAYFTAKTRVGSNHVKFF